MSPKKPLKTIYLIRHGESEHNIAPVYQADTANLSERGRAQAMAMAERMRHVPFDALIASPLTRAQQTAQYIADATSKDIRSSTLFIECKKPTDLEGRSHEDAEASAEWHRWQESLNTPGSERYKDGESYDDFTDRARNALQFLLDQPEESIAVVSHGHFMRMLMAYVLVGDELTPAILHKFLNQITFENTGITVLRYTEGYRGSAPDWRIWTLNDHTHFAE